MRECNVCHIGKEANSENFRPHGRGLSKTCRDCENLKTGPQTGRARNPTPGASGDSYPNPNPGDDLFYFADALKMVADSIAATKAELIREVGLLTKEMSKIEADLRAILQEIEPLKEKKEG
jgi:hypothetical protein